MSRAMPAYWQFAPDIARLSAHIDWS